MDDDHNHHSILRWFNKKGAKHQVQKNTVEKGNKDEDEDVLVVMMTVVMCRDNHYDTVEVNQFLKKNLLYKN